MLFILRVTFYHSEPFLFARNGPATAPFYRYWVRLCRHVISRPPSRSITCVCSAKPSCLGVTEPFLTQKAAFLSRSEPFHTVWRALQTVWNGSEIYPGVVYTLQLCVYTHTAVHTRYSNNIYCTYGKRKIVYVATFIFQ